MKFAVFVALSCICLVNARTINEEHTFGDTNDKVVYGTHLVQAEMPYKNPMEWYTIYEFTFPEVPSDRRIVGIKYIDHHPLTRVQFVKGKIGDNQITLKVIALDHSINSTVVFYSDH